MCGRYFRHTTREQAAASFRALLLDEGEDTTSYNIAPTQPVLTVRFSESEGQRALEQLQWGLVPHFAKDRKVAFRTINARAETLSSSPTFRSSFAKRRCLIVADGFFEWHSVGKHKQPYAIARADGRSFGMAGLWASWKDPESGEWLRSCSIITTDANPLIAPVHDRMPVILEEADHARWLGEVPRTPEALQALLVPYDNQALRMWPVSPRMNRTGELDDASVLEPVTVAPPVAAMPSPRRRRSTRPA